MRRGGPDAEPGPGPEQDAGPGAGPDQDADSGAGPDQDADSGAGPDQRAGPHAVRDAVPDALQARLDQVPEAIARVRARIARAAADAARDPADVRLLLAVKTQPVALVRAALAAGVPLLGHNRAQELLASAPALADVPHEMHFIGHLQSNKVNQVVPWVACVQSVHDAALARRLERAAARAGRTLDVFVQVNTSGQPTKSGPAPRDAPALAAAVARLAHLRLRGFMTIGAASSDPSVVRGSFDRLAEVRDAVVAAGEPGTQAAVELSMGMTGDLEQAVAAGSTMVRVGTGVFGPRPG